MRKLEDPEAPAALSLGSLGHDLGGRSPSLCPSPPPVLSFSKAFCRQPIGQPQLSALSRPLFFSQSPNLQPPYLTNS